MGEVFLFRSKSLIIEIYLLLVVVLRLAIDIRIGREYFFQV